MPEQPEVKIYCCYGTVWGSTEQAVQLVCTLLKEAFQHRNQPVSTFASRITEEALLNEAEIVILASSVISNDFRFNVLKCAREHKELLQTKLSGLLIVNAPYRHYDHYIDLFYKKCGYKADVAATTGGVVNVKEYKKKEGLVRCCNDERIDDCTSEFFGEISRDDLTAFCGKITELYFQRKAQE